MSNLEEYSTTSGGDIFTSYTDEGTTKETTIVFIHGFPLDKSMWNAQRALLKNDYRVITYDLRGYGDSEPGTSEMSIDLLVSDLEKFLDELKLQKAVICGFSMGGYIALSAYEKYPQRFEALILCDTQCLADGPEAKEKRIKDIDFIQGGGLELYADKLLGAFFNPDTTKEKSSEMFHVRKMIESNFEGVVCDTLRALANRKETCSSLHEIKIPVLIMVGRQDIVTPPALAMSMQENIKDSVLKVIENAGHLSMLDNADDFNLHLKDFLKALVKDKYAVVF